MKKDIPKVKFEQLEKSDFKGFEIIPLEKFASKNNIKYKEISHEYHQIDFFAILILTEGRVAHIVDFKTLELKKGDSLIIVKGQVHAFDRKSNYKGYLLFFSELFLHKHITQSTLSKIPFLYNNIENNLIYNNSQNNEILINFILNGLSKNTNVQPNQVGAILSYFLLNLIEKDNTHLIKKNKYQDYFIDFRQAVEQNFQNTRNAKDYADMLKISYKFLNKVCKSMVNKTAKTCIDDYIMLQAKRLLVIRPNSIKEISYKLGFEEPTNFRKYFIKHTGYSPNDFLKKMHLVSH